MTRHDLALLLREKYGYSHTEAYLFEREYPEIINLPKKYRGVVNVEILTDIKRLNDGYPLDYVIGYKQFIDSKIYINKDTLIPRIETEYWVGHALSAGYLNGKSVVLDIFTGSGCIGISVMRRFSQMFVVFSDNSSRALNLTKRNIETNGLDSNNYSIVKSDLFSKLKKVSFDAVFANPPYVATNDAEVGEEIKFEPPSAIYSGNSGLEIINKFIKEAWLHLNPKGIIFMEHGEDQLIEIEKIINESNKYSGYKFHKDQFGKDRWVVIYGQ